MGEQKKLALFDFCGTIFKFQSPDMYADFIAPANRRTRLLQKICNVLARSHRYNGIHHKKVKLYKIKGIPESELIAQARKFVDTVIMKDLVKDVAAELDKYIADKSYDVVIASGGYSMYLKQFCLVKGIPYMVATDIEVKDGKATGKIDGLDCIGINKITKLNEIIDFSQYDMKNSICFSDSMSDRPIFDLVGNKIFVKAEGDSYTLTRL